MLLDGFTSAPVCGNTVNCSGNTGVNGPQARGDSPPAAHRAGGLPPSDAAALLSGLRAFRGATVIPIYSLPQQRRSRRAR